MAKGTPAACPIQKEFVVVRSKVLSWALWEQEWEGYVLFQLAPGI